MKLNLAFFILLLVYFSSTCNTNSNRQVVSTQETSLESHPYYQKLDPKIISLLSRETNVKLNVFIEYQEDLKGIEAQGFSLSGIQGDIATGTLMLADVSKVAQLDNVIFIELAGKIRIER